MSKDTCEMKCTGTEEGFKVEAKGEVFKQCFETFHKRECSCCGCGDGE